jgi:EmrB/QacA subfamily drug resistance transporter
LDQPAAAPVVDHPRRWLALGVLAAAQLMVVLDGTVVNVAMPTVQRALGISDADRQWAFTAYTLAFGGLLLLGGRVADYWGRRRAFVAGAVGFAAASALGGLATSGGTLFAARALQGGFGALLVPAAGSTLAVLFHRPGERARAYAVYGAVAASGSVLGLLVGGLLTEYASWRWCLLVNVPVAALVVAAAAVLLPAGRSGGGHRYDLPGAVLVTAGLVAVVYGAGHAADHGWASTTTVASIAGGLALLAAFVAVESRAAGPLLPLRIVLDRDRGGAYLVSVLSAAGVTAAFLFLTYYFQVVLSYGPVRAGLAVLPVTAGVLLAAATVGRLLPVVGSRAALTCGGLAAAVASGWLTRIDVRGAYASHVLPPAVLLGVGFGLLIVPISELVTRGVRAEAGVASGVFMTAQQVGAALGTALLNTVCTSAAAGYLARRPADPLRALVHGYATAFWWGAALLATAAVVAATLLRPRTPTPAAPAAPAPTATAPTATAPAAPTAPAR